jgi:hypothetical protein
MVALIEIFAPALNFYDRVPGAVLIFVVHFFLREHDAYADNRAIAVTG